MTKTETAKLIAAECGEILAKGFHNIKEISVKSGPCDLVTEWDRASEKHATELVAEYCPEDGLLGEEGTEIKGESGYTWIIDPLDGTLNFATGVPFFAVSVALCRDGKPVAGAVYDPIYKEMFWAEKGAGAYLNDRKLTLNNTVSLENALLYLSWMPWGENLDEVLEKEKYLFATAPHMRRMGSAALGLAYISCGRIHGFMEMGLRPWDVAAGVLLVTEAGGTATDRYGNSLRVDTPAVDVTAGCASVHKEMVILK